MKRNAALLTAGMATVFVSTTAVAAVRVAQHGFTGTRPVVSKRSADPTSSTSASSVAPVVVTRTEDETVFVVVPGSTTLPGGSGVGSAIVPKAIEPEVENEHDDAPTTGSTASTAAPTAPAVESDDHEEADDADDAAEHAAAGGATTGSVERADDEVRTGGGTGGRKGGGAEDHRFPGGGDD